MQEISIALPKFMIIDGKKIADKIIAELKRQPKRKQVLAAVLVGSDASSESFLRAKEACARRIGIRFKLYRLKEKDSFGVAKSLISRLNYDKEVGGIIIQLPLPKAFNREKVIRLLSARKDIDALKGSKLIDPPTVGALKTILKEIKFGPEGKNAVVVGKGFLVGQPIAKWLKSRVKNLSVTDRGSLNLKALSRADLVVSGVGAPGLIKAKFVKSNSILVDFGYGIRGGKVKGDFDFLGAKSQARAITPTPGGTGPIVVAQVFLNFFILTKRQNAGIIRAPIR